jgi:hypothetical protein
MDSLDLYSALFLLFRSLYTDTVKAGVLPSPIEAPDF